MACLLARHLYRPSLSVSGFICLRSVHQIRQNSADYAGWKGVADVNSRYEGDANNGAQARRGKRQFMIGAVIVLVMAVAFASITIWALAIRQKTGSEFSKYVLSHHIGQAVVTNDESGFQDAFCILHLNKPIPDTELQKQAMTLFQAYSSLDGGSHLTLEYTDPKGKTSIEADVVQVDTSHVSLTLHLSSGIKTSVENVSSKTS